MKVLFIGGTGTISQSCARLCAQRGMELSLLVRGTRDERLAPGVEVLRGDLRKDPGGARHLLAGRDFDCVVDFNVYDEEDVGRDVELFQGRTRRFFFISSASAYAKPLPSPRVTEETPLGNPYWEYADKKAACERLFLRKRAESGFPVVIVRPSHTYADFACPTGFSGLGFGIVERILQGKPVVVHGDGLGWWTLTHADEFAELFVPLLDREDAVGEAFQITSDECLTWTQIYRTMGEVLERDVELIPVPSAVLARFDVELGAALLGDKAHSYLFDNSKIKAWAFPAGGRPQGSPVRLREGFTRCVQWLREHPDAAWDRSRGALMDAVAAWARKNIR